jgi:hypothetical protein
MTHRAMCKAKINFIRKRTDAAGCFMRLSDRPYRVSITVSQHCITALAALARSGLGQPEPDGLPD